MRDTANLYLVAAIDFFDYGHMLFCCGISGFFIQKLHRLAAADQLAGTAVKNFHDIAAYRTFVYLKFLSHNFPLSELEF